VPSVAAGDRGHLIAIFLALFGVTLFVSPAQAQRRGSFSSPPTGRTGRAITRPYGVSGGFGRSPRVPRVLYNYGFWPYFYSDYESEPETVEVPPPQTIIVQAAQPVSSAPVPTRPEALVLELQGDHWVRITNHGLSQIVEQPSETAPEAQKSFAVPRQTQTAESASELPPAVLVFRDGHEEEITKYAIVGSTIYISKNYWSKGSWTRKVPIAELDVPATLKVNQARGANFGLPSGPDEVMIRP
jgi:hypothetical protein